MDNTPEIEKLEPTQQGVSEGTKTRKVRKVKKKKGADSGASGGFLSNLKISQKLAAIAVAFAIPSVILLTLLVIDQNQELSVANKERIGIEYLVPLAGIPDHFVELVDAALVFEAGDASAASELQTQVGEVNTLVAQLETLNSRYEDQVSYSASVSALVQAWREFETELSSLSSAEIAEATDNFIEDYLVPVGFAVANGSGLTQDPDLSVFYHAYIVYGILPEFADELGDIAARGNRALNAPTLAQRTQLAGDVDAAGALTDRVERALGFAENRSEGQGGEFAVLERAFEEAELATTLLADRVEEEIVLAPEPTLSANELASLVNTAAKAYLVLANDLTTLVSEELQTRISTTRRNQLVTLFMVALVLVLASALALIISRRINNPVKELATVAENVGKGDLSRFARVSTKDELGTLANSFNQAITGLREVEERNELERQKSAELQQNVGAFLDVAMDIADGDFTKRGNVSEDVLGNIVDAINLMVEEVAYLLGQTRDAALSVNEGASEMIATTESIAQSAQRQAAEAERARAETEQVTDSIRKMAQQADESANASTQALEASRQGEAAVQNTLKGMQGIRNEVQGITERTKSLTQRSDEISGIVRSISRIASQTNLLALSASLEAAGAGEAGKRFATVASEVQELAEDSANAARQVASIIRELQGEINEVAELTESGSKEVEEGYQVATEAGQRLREIADISTKSAELARFISQATQEQVQGVEGVNEIVQTMTEISQASQGSVTQGRDAAERLQQLSAQLTEGLSRFRLSA